MGDHMAQAHKVTTRSGRTNLFVMENTDQVPTAFALTATRAAKRVCVRVGGGCKSITEDEKNAMLDFFRIAFEGYEGMIWSGGTRNAKADGSMDAMITDVPGVVAEGNPKCVALGSFPRTGQLHIVEQSRLVLDQYGTGPSPSVEGLLIVQDSDKDLGWDADLDIAFGLMSQLEESANWKIAHIAWNGGPITRDEIMRSINKGWLTILIEGSGRVVDEMITELDNRTLNPSTTPFLVSKNDPKELRDLLIEKGFIADI